MKPRLARRLIALAVTAALLSTAVPPLRAQAPAPSASDLSAGEGVWPRQLKVNGATVLIYQPQLDKWDGNRLEGRAAVAVRRPNTPAPSFGVIWITARTEVNKEQGLVTLKDIKIPKVSFPAAPPQKMPEYLQLARQHLPAGVRTMPLVQLEADLEINRATQMPAVAVDNNPPRIIVSEAPAVLVRIDGNPALRQVPGSTLLRVINTRALMLLDPATGRYYLYARGRWMEAPAGDGPFSVAVNPPSTLDAVKQALAQQVDLLDDPRPGQPSTIAPAVYVSTVPTELIEIQGPPTWSPIAGTELLTVTNTSAHVFLELKTQMTYVLISGRWFRARSTAGPWEYVAAGQLPSDFAKIPENGPSGVVLASVPGTTQAREAVIANSIPQTATVKRSEAHFTATYDGTPQWRPMPGTPLQYAVNSPMPIIRVDAKTYYALYNGVWFVAVAPVGPWAVAAVVPAVIYTIPPTSPLHYVTYVRVYGFTPTVVYVGYTPGYLGTVVTPDGVVVYGTGVVYTPWVGTVWYPPPPTYGYGAGFAWGAATGFMMGAVAGTAMWGCCWGTSTVNVNVNKTVYNYNGNNVYNSWSKTTVSSGDKSASVYRGPNSAVVTNNQNNNVYASHDGNVYRKDDGQWQKWNGSGNGWQPVNPPTTQKSEPSATTQSPTTKSNSQGSGTQGQTQETRQSGQGQQRPTGQGQQQPSGQGQQRPTGQGQPQPTGQSAQRPASQDAQRPTGQSTATQPRSSGQGLGTQRTGGSQSGGSGNRTSGEGLFQGLNRDSMGRERGAERMNSRFGGFRR